MRRAFAMAMLFVVAACATGPSIYREDSFKKLPWAKKSFTEIEARCQDNSLRHDKNWNNYEVVRPLYKSCMDHYGYRYLGDSEIIGNDVMDTSSHDKSDPTHTIVTSDPAEDKSALYR
jgi:hypothetical protein